MTSAKQKQEQLEAKTNHSEEHRRRCEKLTGQSHSPGDLLCVAGAA